MARSTQLVTLIKNIYTLWGRKLEVLEYFVPYLVYRSLKKKFGAIGKHFLIAFQWYKFLCC